MRALACLVLAGVLGAHCATARQDELSLRQLNHRVFGVIEGAPADIVALAQTTDGTLWVGGRTGLSRFDGVHFTSYPGRGDEPLHGANVSALYAAPDGSLWVGFRPGGVSVLKGGRVKSFTQRDGLPLAPVAQFAMDRAGSMWAATRLGLARLKNGSWEAVQIEADSPTPYGVLVDEAGTLWVATVRGLRARFLGETRFRVIDQRDYGLPLTLFTASNDGAIWAVGSDELVRIEAHGKLQAADIAVVRGVKRGPLLIDSEGNLWASDAEPSSLLRVAARELALGRQGDRVVEPERFSSAEGLRSGRVYALLEDRERNIWVGTNDGLHRFSHSNVLRSVASPCYHGEFTAAAFAAGDNGVLWVACADGSTMWVDEIHDARLVRRHAAPPFSAAHRDHEGNVWFAGATALGRVEAGRIVTTPFPPHVAGRPVQALVRDADGAVWISMSRKSVFRYHAGEWLEYGGVAALPREYALVAAAEASGPVWFGYTDSRLARVDGAMVRLFGASDGLAVGNVLAISACKGDVWIGGELGVARLNGERFTRVISGTETPFRGVSGIICAQNGDYWLNSATGIVRIARSEIARLRGHAAHRVAGDLFNHLDGVPGTAVQLRPQPSAIEATDERVWFSMTAGIVSIDNTRWVRNSVAPPVTIWSLTSGADRYPNRGSPLQLPVHTSSLQIQYTAGSLTVPERVRFRYKLEGVDREWRDAGSHREAHYTNVRPGRYTFRVIASNNDGVWNSTGASMELMIAPAFYQTQWFFALCAAAVLMVLVLLYNIRVRQVAAQVRGRLEARLAERERIARELHDTLLQGMQGLIWKFQAAADLIPQGEHARRLMEESLDRADKLLEEGRDRVKDLRPSASEHDMAQALALEGEHLAELHPAEFKVTIQGSRRDLHPIVGEESLQLACEALRNAFAHAKAKNIEVDIAYGEHALVIRVRDDGHGIPADVLRSGRPGHFGLVGMRERAQKLGAQLRVWTKPEAGTEIELHVPASVAYPTSHKLPSRT